MKSLIVNSLSLIRDSRHNPLRHLDSASQHYFIQMLAGIWATVCVLSFISSFIFHITWLLSLFIVAGLLASTSVFKQAKSRSVVAKPVKNLSHASACVWQMDREA